MNRMEPGLQNILKGGLLILTLVAGPSLTAATENTEETEAEPLILQQGGRVQGDLSLLVEGTDIAATLLPGRLGKTHGKVLILHDSNGGIDSPGLIRTLRQGLPDAGWTTMTVALTYPLESEIYLATTAASAIEPAVAASEAVATAPVDEPASETAAENASPDNISRVLAALAYLETQQPGDTVILTVGKAAQLLDSLVGQTPGPAGLIWIRPELELDSLPEIMPVLDIAPEAAGQINERAMARRIFMQQQEEDVDYAQRRITGAGYGFYGFEKQVLGYVRGWLSKQFVNEEEN
jgi:Protein of unknown function (DUF3530)